MILHIVVRRVYQQDLRRHLPHHGTHLGQQRRLVKDLYVVHEAFVVYGANIRRRRPGLLSPDAYDLRSWQVCGAAAPVGHSHIVEFITSLP